jgi:hypothetical protein
MSRHVQILQPLYHSSDFTLYNLSAHLIVRQMIFARSVDPQPHAPWRQTKCTDPLYVALDI